jgi:protein phosphatase 1 regulatory subunit 7
MVYTFENTHHYGREPYRVGYYGGFQRELDNILNNKYKFVQINGLDAYGKKDIDFIKEFSFIEALHVNVVPPVDFSAIYYMPNLKELTLSYDYDKKLEFSRLPKLESFWAIWGKKLELKANETLRRLTLYHYKKNDFTELSGLHNLELIELRQSTVKSFKGIEGLQHLNTFDSYALTKLADISVLSDIKDSLKYLILDNCKKMQNIDNIAEKLENVITLHLNNGSDLKDIRFITKMKSLKKFVFLDTNVVDGDMSPLIGLDYAAFTSKKHFSHTFREVERLNEEFKVKK